MQVKRRPTHFSSCRGTSVYKADARSSNERASGYFSVGLSDGTRIWLHRLRHRRGRHQRAERIQRTSHSSFFSNPLTSSRHGIHVSPELRRREQESKLGGQLLRVHWRAGIQRDRCAAISDIQREIHFVLRRKSIQILSS